MNIMFEDSITDDIRNKYMLLQLDTFYFSDIDSNRIAYCLLESVPIMEMIDIDRFLELHEGLIRNYAKKNWLYCENALEHLMGHWNKELDSFYLNLARRIQEYKENDPGLDWTGIIHRD
jgi:isoleucyl-tRNA synthetase